MFNRTLSSEDIRPSQFNLVQKQLLLFDQSELFKKSAEFIYVNCPACCHSDYVKVFEKYSFTYVKCEKCETVYINPRPTADMLTEYYSSSQRYAYWNSHIYPATEHIRRERIDIPRVNKIIKVCNELNLTCDNILEVGPGFGIFAEEMKKMSQCKEIVLIEPNKALADTCTRRGLTVVNNAIENAVLYKDSYDIVVAFEVFEHLFSQMDFLRKVHLCLRKNGIVVLTCPNIKGFDIQMLGSEADVIDNENLSYFHPESIRELFSLCGFVILELLTPGKLDVDHVREKILKNKLDITNQVWLNEVLIKSWHKVGANFQEFLSENLMSSHMWIIAQKKDDDNKE